MMKIMMRPIYMFAALCAVLLTGVPSLHAQTVQKSVADTAGLYSERRDSLDAAVSVYRQDGNYIKKGAPIRTEVISSAGLHKMACCNLAESFARSGWHMSRVSGSRASR